MKKGFKNVKVFGLVMVLGVILLAAGTASADPFTLQNRNSSATIDPTLQNGMYNWTVDGTNQLYQQWFWYRIGNTGLAQSIDTLGTPAVSSAGRIADIAYAGSNGLGVEITYTLTGGTSNSHTSDIGEGISLFNNTERSMDLHFFQYSDFDLSGGFGNQTSSILTDSTGAYAAIQRGNGFELTETTSNPSANTWEAALYADTLNNLNYTPGYNLNDTKVAGPGDATWAFEWNINLAPGGSFLISKDKRISPVPEPATLLLLGMGLFGLGVTRKARQK